MNMGTAVRVASLAVSTGYWALGLIPGSTAPAQAGTEHITSYVIGAVIEPGGSVRVRETIRYDFGADQRHGIYRDIPYLQPLNAGQDREVPISGIRVSSPDGAPAQAAISRSGGVLHIRIGSPDRTISGSRIYVISYQLRRALSRVARHAEFSWNLVGDDWTVPISDILAHVSAPAGITSAACFAGSAGSRAGCGSSTRAGRTATFRQASLAAGEGLTVQTEMPAGSVTIQPPLIVTRWSLGAALAPTPAAAGLGAALFIIVAAWLVVPPRWRRWPGATAPGSSGPAASAPEGSASGPRASSPGLLPGQAGVVLVGAARPVHVVATLVDLAIRGYLRIAETGDGHDDWVLDRLPGPHPPPGAAAPPPLLLRYERTLLKGVFARGNRVHVSALKGTFPAVLTRTGRQLTRDAVHRGWLTRRRRTADGWVLGAAGAVLFVTGLLPGLLHGLAFFGLAVMLAGAAAVLTARHDQDRDSRTAEGTRLLAEVRAHRRRLRQLKLGSEDPWTRFAGQLPYAITFGLVKDWVERFATVTQPVPQADWWDASAGQPTILLWQFAPSFTTIMCSYAPPAPVHDHAAITHAGYGHDFGGGTGGMGGGMVGGGGGGGGGGSW